MHTPDELRAVERALAGLRPQSPQLNRDRVLYEAGRASARPAWGRRFLELAATGFVASALTLGITTIPRHVDQPRTLQAQTPPVSASTLPVEPPRPERKAIAVIELDPSSYLALREDLGGDLDVLRSPWPGPARDAPPRDLDPVRIPLRPLDAQRLLDL